MGVRAAIILSLWRATFILSLYPLLNQHGVGGIKTTYRSVSGSITQLPYTPLLEVRLSSAPLPRLSPTSAEVAVLLLGMCILNANEEMQSTDEGWVEAHAE